MAPVAATTACGGCGVDARWLSRLIWRGHCWRGMRSLHTALAARRHDLTRVFAPWRHVCRWLTSPTQTASPTAPASRAY